MLPSPHMAIFTIVNSLSDAYMNCLYDIIGSGNGLSPDRA